jgi:hypothetical protein
MLRPQMAWSRSNFNCCPQNQIMTLQIYHVRILLLVLFPCDQLIIHECTDISVSDHTCSSHPPRNHCPQKTKSLRFSISMRKLYVSHSGKCFTRSWDCPSPKGHTVSGFWPFSNMYKHKYIVLSCVGHPLFPACLIRLVSPSQLPLSSLDILIYISDVCSRHPDGPK